MRLFVAVVFGLLCLFATHLAQAQMGIPGTLTLSIGGGPGGAPGAEQQQVSSVLQIMALLTILTLAPALLIMLTSFTRIIIVLGFVRRALATQEVPPTQVLIGLALFLTFFVMAPTWNRIHQEALGPYFNDEITIQEALTRAEAPTREFLFSNTRKSDLKLFLGMSEIDKPRGKDDVPTYVLVPAFMVSELQTAFLIGFIIYIPFLIIDMVVSSILLSMGMMMLPPVIVSLPFKIILFVLVDGWSLVIGSLVRSFT
jgi:flagellar biosynthetic protein FliP